MLNQKNLRRSDYTLLGQWRWTIDGTLLTVLILMAIMGIVLSFTASPPVAKRIGYGEFYFVYRQIIFGSMAIIVMILLSFLNLKWIRRLSLLVFIFGVLILALLPIIGHSNNGATRWIILPVIHLSIQPSEFVKPALIIMVATVLSEKYRSKGFPGFSLAFLLVVVTITSLVIQPDIGMSALIIVATIVQFYVAGIATWIFFALIPVAAIGIWWIFITQDHVRTRVLQFIESTLGGDTSSLPYQVAVSLRSLRNGGIVGLGPGAGTAKLHLPDAHTDYIFAVIGEEFGLIFCLIIIMLVAFVVIRSLHRAAQQNNQFVMIATAGLSSLFAFQALVNLSSTLSIIPPKGMTLPFISYGGSSTLALAVLAGILLSLTRERPWDTEDIYNE
ncbi:MAG: FtsW/RodA/SpoVE family cell cycle protein [Alphaproteobacteria bacterium]